MLSYAVTASLKEAAIKDIRTLLRDRVMRPIGVTADEWSCGYGKTEEVDGLSLVASWVEEATVLTPRHVSPG